MRQRRTALSVSARYIAARAVARHLARAQLLQRGQRIAVYAAFDGEIDLTSVIRYAQKTQCTIYAPRIVNMRARKMEFVEVQSRVGMFSVFQRSRNSILEPRFNLRSRIDPRLLDVVFVPLIAFDCRGWRLGFGAGFYDRKFSFLRRSFRKKPLLIGVGYEFQRVAVQKPSPWDVLLDGVVTEQGLTRWTKPARYDDAGP